MWAGGPVRGSAFVVQSAVVGTVLTGADPKELTITTAPDTSSPSDDELTHPGFEWLRDAACVDQEEGSAPFFVDAGRVIDSEVERVCRTCPVRRECVRHGYLGGQGKSMIGAGYFGGFSLGQRRRMTLREALAKVAADPLTPPAREG